MPGDGDDDVLRGDDDDGEGGGWDVDDDLELPTDLVRNIFTLWLLITTHTHPKP